MSIVVVDTQLAALPFGTMLRSSMGFLERDIKPLDILIMSKQSLEMFAIIMFRCNQADRVQRALMTAQIEVTHKRLNKVVFVEFSRHDRDAQNDQRSRFGFSKCF